MSERFWSRVEKTEGCWLWTASVDGFGYGQFRQNNVKYSAHRLSWELCNGSIPVGMCVCHKCDVPACVNPDHLFLGTQKDNMRDMHAKGRAGSNPRIGTSNGNAKLTEGAVVSARDLYAAGKSIYQIARFLGVSKSTVWNVVSNKYWRHVNGV